MKWLVTLLAIGAGFAVVAAFMFGNVDSTRVTGSSAQAWIWIAPEQQQQLVAELQDYAKANGLQFQPAHLTGNIWEKSSVELVTVKNNRISIVMTAPNKFSAAIIVSDSSENWQKCWNSFRAFVSGLHKWKDVP
jgi:hypothetical protein